ncbi:MAG TPA: hypothetical protein VJ302_32865 [Blastocatellia bacterium]|nr:hypothetical protein [Blastocatellia bacterium]
MIELLKGRGWLRYLPSMSMLILLSTVSIPTRDHAQDLNFRLLNLERRLDQLQVRVDFVERALQSQNLNRGNEPNSASLVLELQRQQLSLAEQVVTMQKQMLAMQKTIDQLRENAPEKKERPAGEEKPPASTPPRKKTP